ncbi:hypothetical protein [Nocardioides acrostichi]|uniref:Uncharacterized protein n=1 Tax=Nocardioides acrostichi TaxID=2784339 RepID=A0A930V026_9ACTN|nr:hypothetical protein [Nocardioides acrostichi]MBF4163211.1 hypothetical protein [Nocardioides acrostichi]
MADDDSRDSKLEAPSLGLGGLFKRKGSKDKPAETPTLAEEPPAEEASADESATEQIEPVDTPAEPVTEPEPIVAAEPEPEPEPEPVASVEDTQVLGTEGRPLYADEVAGEPAGQPAARTSAVAVQEAPPTPVETAPVETAPVETVPAETALAETAEQPAKPSHGLPTITVPKVSVPKVNMPARIAAAVTGGIVGVLMVALVALALRGCSAARGVDTCGGGPGVTFLIATVLVVTFLGGLLLRLVKVPDPFSSSFLGVGLTSVFSLIFLVGVLDEWWMIIVMPVLTAATFSVSYWVTTAVVEKAD